MRNEVVVNGVKLSRKQVEEALVELNKPSLLPAGTHAKAVDGKMVVVVDKFTREALVKGVDKFYGVHKDKNWGIVLLDGSTRIDVNSDWVEEVK